MKSKLNLLTREIKDIYAQENFQKIENFYAEYIFKNFKVFDLDITQISTDIVVTHSLGFKPEDIVLTFNSAGGDILFKQESFTDKVFVLASTKACRIKFLIGKF